MLPLALVRVRGRSMEPTLHEGDVLLVRRRGRARAGRLAVLDLPRDEHGVPRPRAVKRLLRQEPGGWWIDSDHAGHGVTSFEVGLIRPEAVLGVVVARLRPRPALLTRAHGAPPRGPG